MAVSPIGHVALVTASVFCRLRSDSGQHPLHDPDFHIQVRRRAVHAAAGGVEAAAARRAVRPPAARMEDVGDPEDGLRQPQQGDALLSRLCRPCLALRGRQHQLPPPASRWASATFYCRRDTALLRKRYCCYRCISSRGRCLNSTGEERRGAEPVAHNQPFHCCAAVNVASLPV